MKKFFLVLFVVIGFAYAHAETDFDGAFEVSAVYDQNSIGELTISKMNHIETTLYASFLFDKCFFIDSSVGLLHEIYTDSVYKSLSVYQADISVESGFIIYFVTVGFRGEYNRSIDYLGKPDSLDLNRYKNEMFIRFEF